MSRINLPPLLMMMVTMGKNCEIKSYAGSALLLSHDNLIPTIISHFHTFPSLFIALSISLGQNNRLNIIFQWHYNYINSKALLIFSGIAVLVLVLCPCSRPCHNGKWNGFAIKSIKWGSLLDHHHHRHLHSTGQCNYSPPNTEENRVVALDVHRGIQCPQRIANPPTTTSSVERLRNWNSRVTGITISILIQCWCPVLFATRYILPACCLLPGGIGSCAVHSLVHCSRHFAFDSNEQSLPLHRHHPLHHRHHRFAIPWIETGAVDIILDTRWCRVIYAALSLVSRGGGTQFAFAMWINRAIPDRVSLLPIIRIQSTMTPLLSY